MVIGQPLRVVVVGAGAMGAAAAWEPGASRLRRSRCSTSSASATTSRRRPPARPASSASRTSSAPTSAWRSGSLELWHELEREAGERVLYTSGLLQRGPFALRMAEALRAEGVTVHDLDHRQVAALFPELRPYPDTPAVVQPDGAVTLSRRALQLYADLAARDGAEVFGRERAIALQPTLQRRAGVHRAAARGRRRRRGLRGAVGR